jgi:uncharacterized protein (DUF2141 family)
MRAAIFGLLAVAAAAQDQTGRIEGIVLDSVSHQPVRKAMVSINFTGITRGQDQNKGPQSTTTDFSGAFSFGDLPAGDYRVTIMHQNYPQGTGLVQKRVRVSPGETAARLTVELIPGGAISGRLVDEDGDPLNGCFVQPHPAKNVNQGIPMRQAPMIREDGTYRIYDIPPGKYIITAQCSTPVFQPRPLSEGPDPPPSFAYPMQFYPRASDVKSAQAIELFPGAEKSVDFQFRPTAVTRIHGTLAAGSADWHGVNDLQIQLTPLDGAAFGFGSGARVNLQDGTFELGRIFPGSYKLTAFTQGVPRNGGPPDTSNRIGATMQVDVADKPLEISLQLHRAVDLSGTLEIERGTNNATNPVTPAQINIQLTSDNQFGPPPLPVQANADGSFTIKSVLPGQWRIRLIAPSAFLKSAWLGNDDITNRLLDLTSGSAAPLRILVSTNTASIRGTATAGQMAFSARIEDNSSFQGWSAAQVDPSGQFSFQGLAPGKYRIAVGEPGGPMPEEGGQEVTVGEAETATVEIKPEAKQ